MWRNEGLTLTQKDALRLCLAPKKTSTLQVHTCSTVLTGLTLQKTLMLPLSSWMVLWSLRRTSSPSWARFSAASSAPWRDANWA